MAKVVLKQDSGREEKPTYTFKKNGLYIIIITTSALLGVYFILSIGLTFYQEHLIKMIGFPLSIIVCHLAIKFTAASIYRNIWRCVYGRRRVTLDCKDHISKIAPIGFASGLDIAFSNWGMKNITVSLYVMTKSTAVVFILGFALLFRLEKKSWSVIMIVLMISGGLGMFTYKSSQFDLAGFLLVMFASFSSGLRWTLTQFVMQKADMGLRNPLDMLYTVQPWMLVAVLPLALLIEGQALANELTTKSTSYISHSLSLVIAGAFIALAMELSEYMVVSYTSSLTLSIAGVFKEVCTLVLAVVFKGDQMTTVNTMGLFLCLSGIICHVTVKVCSTAKETPQTSLHKPLLEEASAHFLAEETTSEDERNEDSSTEVLFSILNSRNN